MFFITTIFLVILEHINKIFSQNVPISPCPKTFQYIYDGSEFVGMLIVRNPDMNQVLHVKLTFSVRGKLATNYLGEITLITRGQFPANTPILYKVNFPKSRFLPRVLQILANNKIICFGGGFDQGTFVTQIQLEHTRKLALLPTETKSFVPVQPATNFPKSFGSKWFSSSFEKHPIVQMDNCGRISGSMTQLAFDQTSADEDGPPTELPSSLTKISHGEWPWMAAIYVNNMTSLTYQCGGTLISSRIILSSAHCFSSENHTYAPNEVVAFLGRHNLKNWSEEGSLTVSCEDIFIHPKFDKQMKWFDADIAVLFLRSKVKFNAFIRPACLWSGSTELTFVEGERGVVVGWSTKPNLQSNNSRPEVDTLPRVFLTSIISNQDCFKANDEFENISSNRTFCARTQGAIKPCGGASGSGLMILKNNRWTIRGIVSATIPIPNAESTCDTSEFVVYTDVAKFLDWIFVFKN